MNDANIACRCAADGMVLLENKNDCLPFKNGEIVALFGKSSFELIAGGGGSARVCSPYVKNLTDGLAEKEREGKISVFRTASGVQAYTEKEISKIAKSCDKVIFTLSRKAGEGSDGKAEKGGYYLSDEEESLLARLQSCPDIRSIIVLLNIPAVMDVKWLHDYDKIDAALIVWLPGMDGGTAIADILCGDVNPSGRLTDTFPLDYSDFPSSVSFDEYDYQTHYEEDIYVGYRYFETFEYAKSQVAYPFGYGLSYTDFDIKPVRFESSSDGISVDVAVTNTGKRSGREVVQLYISAPEGKLNKPALELKAFAKTKPLCPGEAETLTLCIRAADMASFDDTGVTGHLAAYVLEKGDYHIYVGKNVRDISLCGSMIINELTVVNQLALKLSGPLDRRLNGKHEYGLFHDIEETAPENAACTVQGVSDKIMLLDVAEQRASMNDFLTQLTDEELISLCHGQPKALVSSVGAVGNLKKYGVPNLQAADGPAGLRMAVPSSWFPCGTLIACAWDPDVGFQVGAAMGNEGAEAKLDILLAPGLNIHRNPLCGRNFEYYSEDPLVSGKTAAAFTNGVQSAGMAATIKHFAVNNREKNRKDNSSQVSERALREIYLRGFEIAVKESSPLFVMTAYNTINGIYASANFGLLTGILRDEWGYQGAVMTDFTDYSHLWRELKAGCNLKMPVGRRKSEDSAALTLEMMKSGRITRREIEKSVGYVLDTIMKTSRFKRQDMSADFKIFSEAETVLSGFEFTEFSGSAKLRRSEDSASGYVLARTGKNMSGLDTCITYHLDVADGGEFDVYCRAATPYAESWLEGFIDGASVLQYKEPMGESIQLQEEDYSMADPAMPDIAWENWLTLKLGTATLTEGAHIFKIIIHGGELPETPDGFVRWEEIGKKGIDINWIKFVPKTV